MGAPSCPDRRARRQRLALAACFISGLMRAAVAPAEEPSLEACQSLVAAVHAELAAKATASAMTRRFVETDLAQALVEAGNGEYDDCLEYAGRARQELRDGAHATPDDLLQR